MEISCARRNPPTGCAHQKALLDQKGSAHPQWYRAPPDCGSQTLHAYRTAVEFLDHRRQQFPVHEIKPLLSTFNMPCSVRHFRCHHAIRPYLGVVAHPAQQPVGNARRTSGAAGDLRAPASSALIFRCRRSAHNGSDLRYRKIKALDNTETVTQRRGKQSGGWWPPR